MFVAPLTIVVGTRPEAIKLAPVTLALEQAGLHPQLLLTGQHPRLDLTALGLGDLPTRQLHRKAGADPHAYADALAAAIGRELNAVRPALVIVQGDTASALGGALAGFRTGVPVAHVEAGLRTFDPALPWPEEDNRVTIDAGAELLFAPTETSAANLRAEGVPGTIHITGNTGIDALRRQVGDLPLRRPRAGGLPRLLVTCHRRENWGTAFLPIALALLELARSPWLGIDVVLHPNPQQASVMRDLLAGNTRVRLLPPLDYPGMIQAMLQASVILSDSGGVQEEAPALGVPLLVLRSKTERPEGIASGNMKLLGRETQLIVTEVKRLLDDPDHYASMATPSLPYGDGHAAGRIVQSIALWLPARHRDAVRLRA
ncbi:UDP-N-acetylglucosamine 2-epimerase (non-hydrolyzing) [Sphingomonas sp. BN140010]|uniref:UDP-N-acetylglucosamine 2-epimerase (non-hydrolyzing) n=1 Tax=Sphingomonas arvum TaxID=2992113 RepID=A0ABT3JCR0_9SPHN|nr:UDP-N-acetylglucosamine 2-epimerase (non-hydrolyzing) [Sphingomonas sp. BN140010]MCW3796699.1 UDP-N-acetylglucosamine 2-epimerase (non-hydrolyzing) [Sphingomonas sp. BN140010]